MSVWFCIPSKRPVKEAQVCVDAWRDMGYRVAVMREKADGPLDVDFLYPVTGYRGWAASVNFLAKILIGQVEMVEWIVTGGDDYYPDQKKRAEEIAAQCADYFATKNGAPTFTHPLGLFGVMQPTGDPWSDSQGRIIERIAGSPWLGREWCRRSFGGNGPLPPYYHHNFADEELQLVAQKLGVFWQRPDLIQEHRHWARARGNVHDQPEWWGPNCGADWQKSKDLFNERRAAGFPGHEPFEDA